MIVSRNEVESMCYRAALGVGLSHGLAEDAAVIGARLAQSRHDGLAIMLRALQGADASPVAAPVFRREAAAWRAAHPFVPALAMGPIMADLRRAEPGVEIAMAKTDEPAILDICLAPDATAEPSGIEAPDEIWRDLGRLAARTYVPASETSRLMGAGAGLSDND